MGPHRDEAELSQLTQAGERFIEQLCRACLVTARQTYECRHRHRGQKNLGILCRPSRLDRALGIPLRTLRVATGEANHAPKEIGARGLIVGRATLVRRLPGGGQGWLARLSDRERSEE